MSSLAALSLIRHRRDARSRASARDVWAQAARDPRAARPYRGLFGGNNAPDENGQVLDLTVSACSAATTMTSVARAVAARPTRILRRRRAASTRRGFASLRYRRNVVDRLSASRRRLERQSSVYTDVDNLVATSAHAGLGLNWTHQQPDVSLGSRRRVAYSPFYSYAVFPAAGVEIPLVAPPASIRHPRDQADENVSLASSLAFTPFVVVARLRSSAQARTTRASTSWTVALSADGENYGAGAGFSYSLTRHASARLGYCYRSQDERYAERPPRLQSHAIDAGIDYARALAFSFSRRTLLSFCDRVDHATTTDGGDHVSRDRQRAA